MIDMWDVPNPKSVLDTSMQTRYDMNKKLVDFDNIPHDLEISILEKYDAEKTRQLPKLNDSRKWMIKNEMVMLLENIQDFKVS